LKQGSILLAIIQITVASQPHKISVIVFEKVV